MTEIWKSIEDWESYEVSNFGNVRSIDRYPPTIDGQKQLHKGAILKQTRKNSGYLVVHLRHGKIKQKYFSVHRLVAQAFIVNPQNKPTINHKDFNPANNHFSNLEWCTQKENLNHSQQAGRMQRDYWKDKRGPTAELSDAQVREIRLLRESGMSFQKIAKKVGSNKKSVERITKGKTYVYVR